MGDTPIFDQRPPLMDRFSRAQRRPTVLIVEDDPLITMMIEEIITAAGFDFESRVNAADGIVALEKSGTRFSARITDIRMPEKGNGWDVGRRAHELLPLLPIIYITGGSADQWRAHGESGSILLQKPFADSMLIPVLTALIA